MKKLLIFIMTFIIALNLVACGGEDTPTDMDSNPNNISTSNESSDVSNVEESKEVEFVTMELGYITMNVPTIFTDYIEKDGMYGVYGPDCSIVVTPTMDVDIEASDWSESLAEETLEAYYGETYTNMELAGFEGNINMNGNTAVFYGFYGTNAEGKERLVQVVRLYNADLTAQYVITFVHSTDNEFFTADIALEIINNITLAQEAQNLTVESEN